MKQVRDGAEIIDLTMLNTEKRAMGQCMEIFLNHKVQENELGKLSAAEKKENRRQAGLMEKAGGAWISTGLMAITNGYIIGPECFAWTPCTWLEKERKEKAKERAGGLECMMLKEKVDLLLVKGATPSEGKWINTDLKVMTQWYTWYGEKAMPNNKEGFFLRYHETRTYGVDNTTYQYPHEERDAVVAGAADTTTILTIPPVPPSHVYRSQYWEVRETVSLGYPKLMVI
jgi:hypothetical protein